jgi:hypothetical protein
VKIVKITFNRTMATPATFFAMGVTTNEFPKLRKNQVDGSREGREGEGGRERTLLQFCVQISFPPEYLASNR